MHRRKRLDDIIGQALNNAGIASPQSETSVQPFLESTSNKIVSCDTTKSSHYDTDIKRIKARKKLVFEDFQENVRKPPTSVPKPDKDVTTTENIQGSHESSNSKHHEILQDKQKNYGSSLYNASVPYTTALTDKNLETGNSVNSELLNMAIEIQELPILNTLVQPTLDWDVNEYRDVSANTELCNLSNFNNNALQLDVKIGNQNSALETPSTSNSVPHIELDTIEHQNICEEAIKDLPTNLPEQEHSTPRSESTILPNSNASTFSSNSTLNPGTRKRSQKPDKRYVDYLSDEDFSTFMDTGDYVESDEWQGSETDSEDNVFNAKKSKKKKKKRTNLRQKQNINSIEEEVVGDAGLRKKKVNQRKDRHEKKVAGKEFRRKDGTVVQEKTVQPNPCAGKKCVNNCENISTERRQQIFDHFYKLTVPRRRDWLVGLTKRQIVKRRRTDSETREYTYKYHINEGEGQRTVCLQFIAATLNVSTKSIYHTVKNSDLGSAQEDMRGKHVPPNKTKPDTIANVINFIKKLPAVPSHYCRQDSTKMYLSEEYKNINAVYGVYKKHSQDSGIDFVSNKVFRRIFTEDFNIGFHVPKKDKCLKCLKLAHIDTVTNPDLAKQKQEHEIEKEESYNRFYAHKNLHKVGCTFSPDTLCASFDLEKVLNTPHGESMLLYYSRKLAVYNLCFYENGTRKVYCYYWDEGNGKRGANEIGSILHKYIKLVDQRCNVKNLLLYCDCCPGQNRNRVIIAMIHSTLQECKNIETIQINYLLTGHTYMPVDSVHAVIENNLKNTIIYAPSQWYTVFKTARNNPFPFEVERLTYEDFNRWDAVSDKYFKGNLTGKISKLRIVTFKKNKPSYITVKYSMNKSAKSTNIEVQSKTRVPLMPCYRSRLPIAKDKYDDLVKLCNDHVIPIQFHSEFKEIPKEATKKATLPDTDIDDVDTN